MAEGALVRDVYPDMPADRAGIAPGDVITAINGEPVDQEHTLPERLYSYEVGDVVTLTVLRGEDEIELQATLAAHPPAPTPPAVVVEPAMPGSGVSPVIPPPARRTRAQPQADPAHAARHRRRDL